MIFALFLGCYGQNFLKVDENLGNVQTTCKKGMVAFVEFYLAIIRIEVEM